MPNPPIAFHKVLALPANLAADAVYYVKIGAARARQFVTDATGDPLEVEGPAPRFEQVFGAVAAQWIVNHNLGFRPAAIRLLSPGGVEFEAHIVHTSVNQFVVSLSPPAAGQVIVQ